MELAAIYRRFRPLYGLWLEITTFPYTRFSTSLPVTPNRKAAINRRTPDKMLSILEQLIDPLRIGLMVLAVAAFIGIVRWTLRRPQERIDAAAQLWKDD